MKNILLFTALTFSTYVLAQQPAATRTSVANGNATNPLTWDCLCIPLPGDHVIINTNVTLDNDWLTSTGNFTINTGKTLTGNSATRNLLVNGGAFTNNGTITIANLYHSGGTFTNNGTINITHQFGNTTGVTSVNNNTMDVTDSLYIDATFVNNNTLSSFGTAVTGSFSNNGSFTTGDFWNSGTVNNSGLPGMHMTHDVYSSGTVINATHMIVDNDLWNSENFTNNDYVEIGHTLYTGDSVQLTANFTNNGLVSIAFDMYSNQNVTGTGDFCVAGTTANSGDITGTVDICDLTGGALDLNVGTVAGTVTFCSSSCAVGIVEEDLKEVKVYPNPFSNRLTVNAEGYENAKFVLQNILGQKIISQTINGKTDISVTDVESGVYFYSVISENKIISSGKLLKE
jgi:hypothetical protein